jgi:hypothetical protein
MQNAEVHEDLAYALKCIMEVALRRKNDKAITSCEELRIQVRLFTNERTRSGELLLSMASGGQDPYPRRTCEHPGV